MTLQQAANTFYKYIEEFHRLINHPVPDSPVFYGRQYSDVIYSGILKKISEELKASSLTRKGLRAGWILEELAEYMEAPYPENEVDALCDLIIFAFGCFVECGYSPGNAFEAVHSANMAKIPAENGKKCEKPEGWEPPEKKILDDISKKILTKN